MGTVLGPSVGALIVVAIETYLADVGSWVTIITGAVFVVCVLAFRRGIVGEVRALVARSFTGVKKPSSSSTSSG
jgi:branched-chain amino acid transport system permease protein